MIAKDFLRALFARAVADPMQSLAAAFPHKPGGRPDGDRRRQGQRADG
jgi:hypothetical protein